MFYFGKVVHIRNKNIRLQVLFKELIKFVFKASQCFSFLFKTRNINDSCPLTHLKIRISLGLRGFINWGFGGLCFVPIIKFNLRFRVFLSRSTERRNGSARHLRCVNWCFGRFFKLFFKTRLKKRWRRFFLGQIKFGLKNMADNAFFNKRGFLPWVLLEIWLVAGQVIIVIEMVWLCSSFNSCGLYFREELKL
jgi:hypothetical protein